MHRFCAAVLLIGALAACSSSSSGGTATPATAASAFVRFANVAPDAGVAAPANPQSEILLFQTANANVVVDGTVVTSLPADSLAASLPSGILQSQVSLTPYVAVPAGAHGIAFQDPSAYTAQGYLAILGTLPNLKSAARYTVVLEGSYCLGTLQIATFTDDAPVNTGLAVYAVAPSSPQRSYDVGLAPSSTKLASVASGARTTVPLQQTTNIDVYAAIGSSQQTLLPSALNAYDTTNAIPFNSLTALSMFIRDGVPSPANGSCPKTATMPALQGAMTN